jgi:hypothetical protein
MKEKRCLKFTGYIYIPNDNVDFNELRYYASRTPGRLILCDEFGKPLPRKAYAFDNLGDMIKFIETARRKLVYKRVKRKNERRNDL